MSAASQCTLAKSSDWVTGQGLDHGAPARVRLHPAEEDAGVVFVRTDRPTAPRIRCRLEHLRSMPRWTSLEEGGEWAHHVEHLLAAVAFAGVDNLLVEMTGDRLPMTCGGRCAPFYEALRAAGLKRQPAPRRTWSLKKPFFYLDPARPGGGDAASPALPGGRYLLALPAEEFSVSYVFDWSHLDEALVAVAEWAGGDPDPAILESRSYLVGEETEQFRAVVSAAVQDELLILRPPFPARDTREAARHKIVDVVGDLRLLGAPVRGRFVAFRTGHRIHHDALRALQQQGLLEPVELKG